MIRSISWPGTAPESEAKLKKWREVGVGGFGGGNVGRYSAGDYAANAAHRSAEEKRMEMRRGEQGGTVDDP